jgi:hypothetical protein
MPNMPSRMPPLPDIVPSLALAECRQWEREAAAAQASLMPMTPPSSPRWRWLALPWRLWLVSPSS